MQVEGFIAVHIGDASMISVTNEACVFMDASGDVINEVGGELWKVQYWEQSKSQ